MSTLSQVVARSIRIRKAMKAQQEGDEDVVCLRAKERSNTESREERAELRAAHREYMPGGTGYYEAKAHFEECVEQQEAGKSEFRNKVYLGDCLKVFLSWSLQYRKWRT